MSEREQTISSFLRELGPEGVEDDSVLVGWILLADWATADNRWLTHDRSEDIVLWTGQGMLHRALTDLEHFDAKEDE